MNNSPTNTPASRDTQTQSWSDRLLVPARSLVALVSVLGVEASLVEASTDRIEKTNRQAIVKKTFTVSGSFSASAANTAPPRIQLESLKEPPSDATTVRAAFELLNKTKEPRTAAMLQRELAPLVLQAQIAPTRPIDPALIATIARNVRPIVNESQTVRPTTSPTQPTTPQPKSLADKFVRTATHRQAVRDVIAIGNAIGEPLIELKKDSPTDVETIQSALFTAITVRNEATCRSLSHALMGLVKPSADPKNPLVFDPTAVPAVASNIRKILE